MILRFFFLHPIHINRNQGKWDQHQNLWSKDFPPIKNARIFYTYQFQKPDVPVIIYYICNFTMINVLRNNLLKKVFAVALLTMLMLKFSTFFISNFSSANDPFAIEKSTAEEKDTKEDTFDKNSKKLFSCDFFVIEYSHHLWIDPLPASFYLHKMQIGSHPVKTVPTPPPNQLV